MIGQDPKSVWYCLRSKTKREHIAAAFVAEQCATEVFAPRVAVWRKTRNGRKLFVEALFPGYFFSHFDWGLLGRRVLSTQGVTGIVRFGDMVPAVSDSVIADLQAAMNEAVQANALAGGLDEGELVEILIGCLRGSTGRVAKATNGSDRVSILIDFLGRSLNVTLPRTAVISSESSGIIVPEQFLRPSKV